jgi:hypothetical protein
MDKVKVGKYTQWLLKNFVSAPMTGEEGEIEKDNPEYKRRFQEYQRLFLEDLHKTTDDLKKYERFKNQLPQDKRDINKITVSELFDLVKDFKLEKVKASKEEKENAKISYEYPGSEIIFRGPKWTLIKIEDKSELGKNAAIFFGGYQDGDNDESRWCTSGPGLTFFNGYIKDGPLYVVLPNDDNGKVGKRTGLPKERYQFHFPSSQFMDREDRHVNLTELLNGPMNELKESFKPEFAKGLAKENGKRVDIVYPESSAGKFVGLYGFKELFDNLPDDLEQLIIQTSKNIKETIALEVPESIGRFDKLQTLLLGGMVKSVPNSICNLTSLLLLALPNNPQLTTIPTCIKDLPMLGFLNVSGSNVKLPEELKDVLHEEGDGYYYVV